MGGAYGHIVVGGAYGHIETRGTGGICELSPIRQLACVQEDTTVLGHF
jgi:hypothetical protein